MRKLRIFEHISLDGVIQIRGQGADNDYPYGDWTAPYRGPAGRDAVVAAQGERFDLLLGRRTYDIWSGFWPKAPGSPLSDAINAACHPCGQATDCPIRGALVRGTRYAYVQILNADAAFVFVYDENQKLIAELGWSANLGTWSCTAGPADFDPAEAMSLLPVLGAGDLTSMCGV